ncbi:MAG TPA: GYF domain-containing protein [Candidatus Cloacimonadota bacterium]|nr:GYF domain-containing protein [Candidatus Cloacimonadota bacterium]
MSNWIYSKNGKEYGPMSTSKVADAILRGELELDDYVLSAETQLWKKAKEVQAIMDIVHKPLPNNLFDDVNREEFSSFIQGDDSVLAEPVFFNISYTRLMALQVLTLGLFQSYWFIRQWLYAIRRSDRRAMRSSLMILFFAYFIFSEIETDRSLNKAAHPGWSAWRMAILWYLVIPLAVFGAHSTNPILDIVLSLPVLIFSTSLVLIPIQKYINECNEKLKRPVSKLGLGYYLTILLGIAAAVALLTVSF